MELYFPKSNSNVYTAAPVPQPNSDYLPGPQIDHLPENAVIKPVTTITACAGFGKTQAVYSFLRYYEKAGAVTVTVSKGADSIDFAPVNMVQKGDVVITQDYGLAAMCLARSTCRRITACYQ